MRIFLNNQPTLFRTVQVAITIVSNPTGEYQGMPHTTLWTAEEQVQSGSHLHHNFALRELPPGYWRWTHCRNHRTPQFQEDSFDHQFPWRYNVSFAKREWEAVYSGAGQCSDIQGWSGVLFILSGGILPQQSHYQYRVPKVTSTSVCVPNAVLA